MAEQLPDGNALRHRRLGQVVGRRSVEIDETLVVQLEHDRGDEGLGHASDPEPLIRSDRVALGLNAR